MSAGPQDGNGTPPQTEQEVYDAAQAAAAAQIPATPAQPIPPQPAATPPPAAAPARSAIDDFKARGFPVEGYQSDDELFTDLTAIIQRGQQQQQQLDQVKPDLDDYLSQKEQFEQWRQQQQAPPEPEPPPKPFDLPTLSDRAAQLWDVAQIGPGNRGRLGIFNSTSGQYETDGPYDRELREIEEYQRGMQRANRQFLENPHDKLGINEMQERLDSLEKRYQDDVTNRATSDIEQYVKQNQNEYYEIEGDQPKTTMHEGQAIPVLNAKGRVQQQVYESMTAAGISESDAFWASVKAAENVPGNGQSAPPPAPEPPAAPAQPFLQPIRKSQAQPNQQPNIIPAAPAPQSVAAAAALERPHEPNDMDLWRQAEEIAKQQV